MLKRIFSRKPVEVLPSFAPKGECAYVVGDIHGCLEPLERLLEKIEACATDVHPHVKTTLIFVGDLIDRGPHSAQVVERLLHYSHPDITTQFLMGNHEEVFLDVLNGNVDAMIRWFDWGGRDAARSYGVDNLGLLPISPEQVLYRLQELVPQSHIDFLSQFQPSFRFGDYIIVHAGLKPKVPLEQQKDHDLRWIRDPFLSYKGQFPLKVVHGHTIVGEPENHSNRIAVDTGAYLEDGALTAAFLFKDHVEFITEPSQAA